MTGRPLTETCPLYKVSLETFTTFVNNYVAENVDNAKLKEEEEEEEIKKFMAQVVTRHAVVKRAAQGVVDGDDVIKSTCWECGKQEVADIRKCSRCLAARYCGRDCQLKR